MEVKDIEVDLYNYHSYLQNNQQFKFYDKNDFQVFTQFHSSNSFSVIVRRLDRQEGWNEDLKVMVCYLTEKKTQILELGSSTECEKEIQVTVDFTIYESSQPITRLPQYQMIHAPEVKAIDRHQFNQMFQADIVCLPVELYAVGLNNNIIYMYNEAFSHYHEILPSIQHIISVALTFTSYHRFYFIICGYDGYMQNHYLSNRAIPIQIKEFEHKNKSNVVMKLEETYPIFHRKKWILAPTNHWNFPYTIDIIDRHYFYCGLYNSFRSFHQGIPFDQKINKIVFAGRKERGSQYNFTKRRDIEMNQRQYFYSDHVPKDNIVCSQDSWIYDVDMIKYKYILNIDGNASTWDATAWKLNSGSVIFKTEACWRQWFYDEYKPWEHFIPIADDFSDLQEKYHWCEENQEKCEEIIKNAKKLFQKVYCFHNAIDYTIQVLDKINK
jgi:hypothetical protein